MSDTIVVRVQTKVGTWRLSDIPLSCTISQLKERIAAEYAVPADHQRISSDIRGKEEIPDSTSLKDLNARNGHRVFFSSDVEFGAGGGTGVKTGVDKNGNLVLKPADTAKRGFRPGLLPLSNIKRSWGIGEMEALDAQYTYEFKDPLKLECETCVMETQAADIFTTYAKQTKFAPRAAFLYGRYSEDGSSTEVHAIYEPPQSVDEFGAIEVHDEAPDAQLRVDAVARGLCLTKVGVMFCHAYRKTKTAMSSMEVLFAAEQQLESCDGDIDATPNRFVTVVVRQTEEGLADFQAFQVTRQCMEMVAKGMLLWGMEDPYQCDIHEMFTALTVKHNKEKTRVMKNEDKSVPVEFLIQTVALKSHRCPFLDPLDFPVANRPGSSTGHQILSHYFHSHSRETHGQKLADFQVLVALGQIFNAEDMREICNFVLNQSTQELGEGYKLVIDSL